MLRSLINGKKIKRALLYALLLVVVMTFQDLIFSEIAIFGVRAMFVPAAVVAAGLFEGGVWGGLFGLAAGLFCDYTFTESTVLFTALFPVIGFFAGVASQYLTTKRFVAFMALAVLGLVLTALMQMCGVWIKDGSSFGYFMRTALLQTLWSIPPAAAVYPPCRAIHGGILD